MQNTRVTGSHSLPPRFQRTTHGQAICIAGQEALRSEPGRMLCEAVNLETQMQRRLLRVRYAWNVEDLLKHLKAGNTTSLERGCMSRNKQSTEGQATQDPWGSKDASNTQLPDMEL